MNKKKIIITGAIVLAAIFGLAVGLPYLRGINLFGVNNVYYGVYDNVGGVKAGNEIRYRGMTVGVVTKVQIHPDNYNKVLLEFNISNPDLRPMKGTVAGINGDLLGLNTIILTLPEEETADYMSPGDTMLTEIPIDLKAEIDERLKPIIAKANTIMATLDTATQFLQSIFGDNKEDLDKGFKALKDGLSRLSTTIDNMDLLVAQTKNDFADISSNVKTLTSNLNNTNKRIDSILDNVNDFSKKLTEVEIEVIAKDVQETFKEISKITKEIESGDGTLHQLIYDKTAGDELTLLLHNAAALVDNINNHPNRYLQFSVFGSKDKSLHLDQKDIKPLKKFLRQDSLIQKYRK